MDSLLTGMKRASLEPGQAGYLNGLENPAIGILGDVMLVDKTGKAITSFGGGGGASGGGWSNASDQITATPTVGAKTITITGLPFTLEAKHVVAGSIKLIRAGVVTDVPITSVTVAGGVITLADAVDFIAGDEVVVLFAGPDKGLNEDKTAMYAILLNPEYAHTTSVETLVSESAWPGLKPTADAGGTATQIVDADGAFTAGNTIVGKTAYNITEVTSALVTAWVSGTQINLGAGATSWATDVYSLPQVKRYEVSMDTYKNLTIHYRLTCNATSTVFMKLFGTLDSSATVDARTNWIDMSTEKLGAAELTVTNNTLEAIKEIKDNTMLKYMVELVVTDSAAAASSNVFTIFTKKS